VNINQKTSNHQGDKPEVGTENRAKPTQGEIQTQEKQKTKP